MSSTPHQAAYVSPSTCITHNIIGHHNNEVRKILRDAQDVTKRPPPPPNFRQIPICSIGHPQSLTNFTIDSSEVQYTKDCPEWKTESKAVPPHDLYFDKLVTMRTPYIRALDLEKVFKDLANSVANVQPKDVTQSSDTDVTMWCKAEIWKNLQPVVISKEMQFPNRNNLKDKMMRQTEMKCRSAMAEIRNAATQLQAITNIKEEMIQVLIRESKTFGFYTNRCGEMGEVAVKQSIHKILAEKNIPSLTLSGFRVSTYLGDSLARVGITLHQDAEMDAATFIPDGDRVNINFIQSKVLLETDTEAKLEEKVKDKVAYSLLQTRKDLEALLAVMPDISAGQLDKIKIGTFSALPVTVRPKNICGACDKMIIFHNDLTTTKKEASISNTLVNVLKGLPALSSPLARKIGLPNILPPTPESLHLYKTLNARFIGVSSIHPMKKYTTFLTKQEKQFEDLERAVKKEPQRALYLTPQQNAAIQSQHFMLVGPFGSGKTTVLELSVQNILHKLRNYPRPPQIFLVVWDNSADLLARFKKFASEGVQVFGCEEIFRQLGVNLDKEKRLLSFNNLCRAIAIKFKVAATDEVFLITDEMSPNPVADDVNNMDWRGLDTRGINVILSVKPLTSDWSSSNSSSSPQVLSPASMPTIRLDRVLRCTQSILNLVHGLFKAMQADSSSYTKPNINFSLQNVTAGHEIHGELPEVVLLPNCNYSTCKCGIRCRSPVQCFLSPHWGTLQTILHTLVTVDTVPQQDITVLVHTYKDTAAAQAWLERKLGHGYSGVRVKRLDEFRGMESPLLVYLGDGGGSGSELADALEGITRVTSRVIIVHKKGDGYSLDKYLPAMLQQRLVLDASHKYYKHSTGNDAAISIVMMVVVMVVACLLALDGLGLGDILASILQQGLAVNASVV